MIGLFLKKIIIELITRVWKKYNKKITSTYPNTIQKQYLKYEHIMYLEIKLKKSHIWETKNLSNDADSRTNINLKRLHNLSFKKNNNN